MKTELGRAGPGKASNAVPRPGAAVRLRAIEARRRQGERFKGDKKMYSNAQMAPRTIRKYSASSQGDEKLPENAVTRLGLSARAHDRILKVALTIRDLDSAESVEAKHLSEAIQYGTLDQPYWA